MKIKIGRLFLKSRKTKLSRSVLHIKVPSLLPLVRRLFCCVRSKISSCKSRGRIPLNTQTLGRPLPKVVPQGCVAIQVGQEQQRYVIPILYLSHPFITKLLMEAENEFGYEQRGTLTLPCELDDLEQLKWLIDREETPNFHRKHI
ncbi:hypothetical protein SUGI_0629780 [Cryptomeria japonica]|uniref:auxin-responsive protein SAUR32-like n=1 Tax=Cryptomeria japonica TaxID=3369 RepID=UPI002414A381|nr:auxin-responsive protein SAUR32-like [Cryptomeria japonica]GLJ31385.1 hypothetical protein SUGI_0629780 [Cryptomeria japonica]